MWIVIRRIMSVFVSLAILAAGAAVGELPKGVDMPAANTGNYGRWVNPFIGTGGIPWTCGMLSPAATAPFGSVKLGPDTAFPGGVYLFKTNTSGYYYEQSRILGFSHNRLSGTGAEDYGYFRVTPSAGAARAEHRRLNALLYSHANEAAGAGYYAVYLPTVNCLAELTATTHAGVHRYTFNTDKTAHLFLDATSFIGDGRAEDGAISINAQTGEITGKCVSQTGFASRYGGLKVYFAAKLDTPVETYATWDENGCVEGRAEAAGNDVGVDISFGRLNGKSVELKLATSFISIDNAKENLEAETAGRSFDEIKAETQGKWEAWLSRIEIQTESDKVKTIFYTALYHSMIMPSNFTDVNGEYLGFDGRVAAAEGFTYRTDMSLWDSFRTAHPLYTLIAPEIQTDCLNSLVAMARAGGTLPRWPAGSGYTGSMFGSPADMVIAESYLKGLTDFDAEAAYGYMKKVSDGEAAVTDRRDGAAEYNQYGYCPVDLVENRSVSRTLEYSWADGSIALLAEALGKAEEAEKYRAKSMNYKNLFNPDTMYFQPRYSDLSWYEPFNPRITPYYDAVIVGDYTGGFCEGSPRQWRWSAVHDTRGMIELFGSEEYFCSELEAFIADASRNRAAINPGSGYWIGNQHDMHAPYLFDDAGRPELTQKWVRWALNERFSTDVNGVDGNDDGGTLSAWYIFSSLGFYPVAGTDRYWIGAPLVESAELDLGSGKTLKIVAENQSDKNIYVQRVTLNGVRLEEASITHDMIADGGTMVFTLGASPAENGGF